MIRKPTILVLLLASLLLCLANCNIILDIWGTYSNSFYQCIKQKGYDKVMLNLNSRSQGINPQDVQNIHNAKNAGLEVEPAMTPCRIFSAAHQAERIMKAAGNNLFTKLWAIPLKNDETCQWRPEAAEQNCEYLQSFIKEMKKYNVTVGVGATRDEWLGKFGGIQACPEVSYTPLWWIPMRQQADGQYNFNSYRQIGGWKVPFSKQVSSQYTCGASIDLNYYQ